MGSWAWPEWMEDRAVARNTDPETSHAAAKSVGSDRIRSSQKIILNLLRKFGPMTDAEIAGLMKVGFSPSGTRTRRKELVDKGLVRDSGNRKRTSSGRSTIVWVAA